MAEEANIARTRRRRATGILAAGLALGGAAAVAPGTAGQAAPAGGTYDAASVQADRSTKLPHFRAGNFTPPTPGQKGALFQSTTTGATPRIVGGTTVSASQYPWIVGVVTYLDGNAGVGWCTGTVIAPNKVLTAAHCTADGAGTTRVVAGHDRLFDDNRNLITNVGYIAEVGSTWTHQGWNIAAQYAGTANIILDDVSVLTLKQNLPSAYTPITLAAQGEAAYAVGDMADVVGYGVAYEGSTEVEDSQLRKASVPIRSDADCAADADSDSIGYDANRMLCAGNGGGTIDSPVPDSCFGDSGGPLLVNGKQVGITDWGHGTYCGEHPGFYEEVNYYSNAIKADLTRPPLVNADWTGDGHTDLMSRDGSGNLWLHVGNGFENNGYGGFWDSRKFNSGWGSFKRVFRVYNWNGDKKPSIMVVKTTGELYIYNTDGNGNFVGGAKKIGTGWGNFTALMVTNNWLGNNLPSLMVRKSNGELWRYTSNGAGGWLNPAGTRIGTGWNGFNLFLTPGAWKGDGLEVIIGRTSTGYLRLYQTDGKGGWTNPAGTQIGSGWGGFKNIITPGDWNGDNMMDMLGVDGSYRVRMYTTDGKGNWINASGKVISTGIWTSQGTYYGWNTMNLVF